MDKSAYGCEYAFMRTTLEFPDAMFRQMKANAALKGETLKEYITVLMPVYNAERFLRETIQSLRAQTFTDFEVLLYDDGSTDDSLQIARTNADDRFVIRDSDVNRGYVHWLNVGLSEARGEFIARMDADDIALPERFERQVEFLRSHPDVGLVGTACTVVDSAGAELFPIVKPATDVEIRWAALLDNPFLHPTVMFRRSALAGNIGSYDASLMPTEDYDLWVRMLGVTKGANIPEVLLRYRQHNKQVSEALRVRQLQHHTAVASKALQAFLPGTKMTEPDIAVVCRWYQEGTKATLTPSKMETISTWMPRLLKAFEERYIGMPGLESVKLSIKEKLGKLLWRSGFQASSVKMILRHPGIALVALRQLFQYPLATSAAPPDRDALPKTPGVAMNILQVNAHDFYGGAETIMRSLHEGYCVRGSQAWMAVGRKHLDEPHVFEMDHDRYRTFWCRSCRSMADTIASNLSGTWARDVRKALGMWLAEPVRHVRIALGHEDFEYPGTRHLLELTDRRPDLVHCHNLHGNYFDLHALESLSAQVPVFLTLHDAWLLTGHCSHPLDCEQLKTGCEACFYRDTFPKIRRDAASYNLERKRKILERCRLHVATPSRWLMHMVNQSRIQAGILSRRVIPSGIDLNVFHEGDKAAARKELGVPMDVSMLLYVARNARTNQFKDWSVMERAVLEAGRQLDAKLGLCVVGETGEPIHGDNAAIHFINPQNSPQLIAKYYQAADLCVHAARAENYPTVILESLACGTPVIASGVGGVVEQIQCLDVPEKGWDTRGEAPKITGADPATGIVVKPGDTDAMTRAIVRLLSDAYLRQRLGKNAASYAKESFGMDKMVAAYWDWFRRVC